MSKAEPAWWKAWNLHLTLHTGDENGCDGEYACYIAGYRAGSRLPTANALARSFYEMETGNRDWAYGEEAMTNRERQRRIDAAALWLNAIRRLRKGKPRAGADGGGE